jgi:PKD repeat protein
MTRNREFLRWMNLARTSPSAPLEADRPHRPRRALRRLGLAAALVAAALLVAQVVFAEPPNGDFNVSDTVPQVDEPVTFTALNVADPDQPPHDPVTVTWNFGDNSPTATGNVVSHAYSSPGPKTVTMTLTDSNPAGAEVREVIKTDVLRVNARPTAAVSCSPSTVPPNQATTCDGGGSSDPDNSSDGNPTEISTYEWDIDGDGFDDGSDVSEQFSVPPPGRTVRLRVTDSDGGTSSIASQDVTVSNVSPTASFSVSPPNPTVNQAVTFDGSGSSDPEGQALTYAWDLDGDGQFNDPAGCPSRPGDASCASRSFLTARDHTVQLRVTDPENNSDTETKIVRVTGSAPSASFTFSGRNPATPGVPDVGETIDFTSTSTDPNGAGDIARFDWDLDGDGQFNNGSGPTISHSFNTPGPKTVGLLVTDLSGLSHSTTRTVRVNALPTASFTCSPANPAPNEPIACNGSGSTDPEGAVTHAWDIDGDGFDDGGDASETFSFPAAGAYTIRLRVTDSDSATSIPAERVVPVGNTAPTATISAVTPLGQANGNLPHVGREMRFEGSGSDLNGDNLSYSWDFGDGQTAAGPTVTHAYSSPGNKAVTLTVFDGTHTTPATTQVVVNAVPRAGFTVAPENAFLDDNVTLSSTSADPDGPLTAQEWDLDNDGQFDDANAAVVTARFARAGTYPLALRVTDSRGATTTTTGQVTVNNRPILPPPPTPLLSGVVIEGRFLLFRRDTKVKSLRVRAPAGSKISVRCLGKKNCPKRMTKTSKGSKKLPFKKLQRKFRPKTKLIITVTKSGFIGRQTTFTMRRRKPPLRRDLCLNPGAKTATPCPSG